MKITEKLALDAFKNDKETHISLDQKICHTSKERFCIYTCPANLYSLNEKREIVVEFANCLIKNVTERLIKKGSLTHNGCYRITDP